MFQLVHYVTCTVRKAGCWHSTEMSSCCSHTFEVAPAFVVVERYMVEKMLKLVGYEQGDGLFFPGKFLPMVCIIQPVKD